MQGMRKNSTMFLALIFVGLLLYWYFFIHKSDSGPVVTSSQELPGTQSSELLNALGNLQNINFDGTIFADPVFLSLTDFSIQLTPQPKGRPNPFAPLSFSGSGSSLPAGISSGTRTN